MIGLFKKDTPATQSLGPLEVSILQIMWAHGEGNVRDVIDRLGRPLAYTTVMTTLDRLYKKGVLARRKVERAFIYYAAFTREEWDQKRAGDFVAGFRSPELLISCLVEAVGQHDKALLDDLEKKIRLKRKELDRKVKP
jgi:predicted transcriptional regulator